MPTREEEKENLVNRGLLCPYCDSATSIRIKKGHRWRYCPLCGASVMCHPGSETAMGSVASVRLRRLRYEAHRWFDAIWKHKLKKSRFNAYSWLSLRLDMNKDKVHFAIMSEEDCMRAIERCRDLIMNKAPELYSEMTQHRKPETDTLSERNSDDNP